MFPLHASLVKYDGPQLVSRASEKKSARERALKSSSALPSVGNATPHPPASQKKRSSDVQVLPQDVLQGIEPKRQWIENGQAWVQQLSQAPSNRTEVINLQDDLDVRLQKRQARETGICPVRRQLYSQCFDELIRQVTLNCPERGQLLLRIRDEISVTIEAYQMLYDSSLAFCMRKSLQAKQGKIDMETKLTALEKKKSDLEHQVTDWKARCELAEKRSVEQRQLDEKKRTEEAQFWKRTNAQLQTQVDANDTSKG